MYWVFVCLTSMFFYDRLMLNTTTADDYEFLMYFVLMQIFRLLYL